MEKRTTTYNIISFGRFCYKITICFLLRIRILHFCACCIHEILLISSVKNEQFRPLKHHAPLYSLVVVSPGLDLGTSLAVNALRTTKGADCVAGHASLENKYIVNKILLWTGKFKMNAKHATINFAFVNKDFFRFRDNTSVQVKCCGSK